jgi:uncharacterized protein (DUF2062 family)
VDTTRLSTYRAQVRETFEAAFGADHPPKDTALSFAFALFIAGLPNFGLALVLFAVLARYVDRVSGLALVAAIVVMNPPVKWAIYAGGFWLGSRLLGPVPGVSVTEFSLADLSLSTGPELFGRVFLGSFIIAAICAVVGYVVALRFIHLLRQREIDLADKLPDSLSD